MEIIEIKDYKTITKYIQNFDSKNLNRYINLIQFYEKNCIHDIFKLSAYIFLKMENKAINNKFNYFLKSLRQNIDKLNKYQTKSDIEISLPEWFDKDFEAEDISKEQLNELEVLFDEIRK